MLFGAVKMKAKNGFYCCVLNDCVYHQTDDGVDVLVDDAWCNDYDFGIQPIENCEVLNKTMLFLGE